MHRLGGHGCRRLRQPRLARDRTGQRARGRARREGANLNATYEALPENAKGKGGAKFRATVPVWIHVISDGATGNVSQSVLDEQMTVLNLGFAGFYGGAKSGFSFTLAGVTRTDNAAWYNARAGGNAERGHEERRCTEGVSRPSTSTRTSPAASSATPTSPASADHISASRRDRAELGVDARRLADVRGALRPRLHAGARGGPLVQPRAHLLRRLQCEGRLRRRHARRCACRRAAARRARTRAPSPASIRSTTTWTTRTTPATRSSPRARSPRAQDSLAPLPELRSPLAAKGAGPLAPPRLHSILPAPVAQGIERSPPEREIGGSNPPGRIDNGFGLRRAQQSPGRLRIL